MIEPKGAHLTQEIDASAETLGPSRTVTVGNAEFTLLGTAHVSAESAAEVRAAIETGVFDRVAIELCGSRYQALTGARQFAEMDLFRVVREGKAGMVAASLAIGAYQQRLADQLGVEPGAEMRAAIEACDEAGLPLDLIDREIGTTLRRAYQRVPWWQRFSLLSGFVASLFTREQVSAEDIEQLKEGDILEATFNEFAAQSAGLHEVLIDERDRYMAASLHARDAAPSRTLVVVGAGHLKGLAGHLEQGFDDPGATQEQLEATPPRKPWLKWLSWLIVIAVLAGFAVGFSRSPELGVQLIVTWIVVNGTLSALGAAAARAHPLTVAAAFVAAPLTSLHPMIGAGMVTAAVEVWLRKPRVGDFATLRDEVKSVTGWWRNRVSRTLLVFLFSSLGSAAGTYIGGFLIAGQLLT